jgi:hypothetical protein
MMAVRVNCPGCGEAAQVEKVSTVYLLGIGLKRKMAENPGRTAPAAVNHFYLEMPAEKLREVSRKLAPPSSGKSGFTRLVHPDVFVLTFSLILPFFVVGIYASQRGVLLPMLAVLAVFAGWYLWKRKSMIIRYERQQNERKAAETRAKNGIENWLRLYYCAQCDGVFELDAEEVVQPSEIGRLLAR